MQADWSAAFTASCSEVHSPIVSSIPARTLKRSPRARSRAPGLRGAGPRGGAIDTPHEWKHLPLPAERGRKKAVVSSCDQPRKASPRDYLGAGAKREPWHVKEDSKTAQTQNSEQEFFHANAIAVHFIIGTQNFARKFCGRFICLQSASRRRAAKAEGLAQSKTLRVFQ